MPRDFPDMQSLTRSAENRGYRPPSEGESEQAYRAALADFVAGVDLIEAAEIRNKVGWDKQDPHTLLAELLFGGPAHRNRRAVNVPAAEDTRKRHIKTRLGA